MDKFYIFFSIVNLLICIEWDIFFKTKTNKKFFEWKVFIFIFLNAILGVEQFHRPSNQLAVTLYMHICACMYQMLLQFIYVQG